ncbi:uncharacterized protein [Panulirus ornatus]|uniref:uncharacterized protein n=1 Tax=Panulirus ornatus TaxID=150431 RepID=UPI003A8C0F4E
MPEVEEVSPAGSNFRGPEVAKPPWCVLRMVRKGRIVDTVCVLLVVAASFLCLDPVLADPGRPGLATEGRSRVARQISHAIFRPGIDDHERIDIIFGGKDANDPSAAALSSRPRPGSGFRTPPIRFGRPSRDWVQFA